MTLLHRYLPTVNPSLRFVPPSVHSHHGRMAAFPLPFCNGSKEIIPVLMQQDSRRAHSWSYLFLPDGLLGAIHEYLHPFGR